MGIAFKIMAFSLVLNLAVGIMLAAIPVFNDPTIQGSLIVDDTMNQGINSSLTNVDVAPYTQMQSPSLVYRILDLFTLGLNFSIVQTLDQYMFGIIKIMQGIFGGWMGASLSLSVFGGLRAILISVYAYCFWRMWKGYDIEE